MARLRSKIKEVCQNEGCSHFRKEEGKDIVKRGTNTAKHQRYYCYNCNQYFVETKGTPLYKRKLSERKIKAVCKEFVETRGIRSTERMVHVHRDTVSNLIDSIGEHALEMTNYLVHDLKLSTYEADELFTIIKKNRKNLSQKSMISLDKARQSLQRL
jgi:transposase-like protein